MPTGGAVTQRTSRPTGGAVTRPTSSPTGGAVTQRPSFPQTPEEEDRGSSSAHRASHVHILPDMKPSRSRDPSDGGETPGEHVTEPEAQDFCPGYKDVDAFTKVGDPCGAEWSPAVPPPSGPGQRGPPWAPSPATQTPLAPSVRPPF